MSTRRESVIRVDLSNPGQFFACCGVLELAGRVWPGTEGYFSFGDGAFRLSSERADFDPELLIRRLGECTISGLSDDEKEERERLEEECRRLKKAKKKLSPEDEARRKELGTRARKGAVDLGSPFHVVLNWWQADDGEATPKTWAGLQEIHKVARAAQDALTDIADIEHALDFGSVLRMPREYRRKEPDRNKTVEPFYFDARRFASALNTGWSLDAQEAECIAYPAVELLSLTGLQRFRPRSSPDRWLFEYCAWGIPLTSGIAAVVANGCVRTSPLKTFRFRLRFRDDQKRYKAFGFADDVGGN